MVKVAGWVGNFCPYLSSGVFGAVGLQEFIRMIPNLQDGMGEGSGEGIKRERENGNRSLFMFSVVLIR